MVKSQANIGPTGTEPLMLTKILNDFRLHKRSKLSPCLIKALANSKKRFSSCKWQIIKWKLIWGFSNLGHQKFKPWTYLALINNAKK